jgi:hypothetical protein
VRYLERRRVIEAGDGLTVVPDTLADREARN